MQIDHAILLQHEVDRYTFYERSITARMVGWRYYAHDMSRVVGSERDN